MNRSLLFKLGAIALLMLLLLIPLLMINGIISDRQQLRDGVLMDIARSSSYSQRITGPVMVVPYRKTVREWKLNEKLNKRYEETREERGRLYFCRTALNSTARCKPNCDRVASTRRDCSMQTTASVGVSSCQRSWALQKTLPITVLSLRFWRWVSAIFVASKTP